MRAKEKTREKIRKEEEEILRKLPRLLKTNGRFKTEVIEILLDFFPSREEFSQILKKLDQIMSVQEEHSKILQEHSKILQEHSRKLEEHSKILMEHSEVIRELVNEVKEMKKTLGRIGSRWGIMVEDMFRKAQAEILKAILGQEYKIEREVFEYQGVKGEVDIVVKDGRKILIEVSSSLNTEKAKGILRKLGAYKSMEMEKGRQPECFVISASVSADAVILLSSQNIKVITPEPEEE